MMVEDPFVERLSGRAGRILVIDDDRDVCELLAVALTGDGYTVDCGLSCEEALSHLRRERYGLVITDYELPDGTAPTWMRTATRAGLLEGTPVLMATGHPDPRGVGRSEILRKPFDLEQLQRQVRRMVDGGVAAQEGAHPGLGPATGPVVELVLYVTPGTAASEKAQQHLTELTDGLPRGTCSVAVRDVAAHAEEAEKDHVIFTPTLVKRHPLPPTWVVGDLSHREHLAGLLKFWGGSIHA
jgi:CheY-like chemotaxis protein